MSNLSTDQIKAITLFAVIATQVIRDKQHNPPRMVQAAERVLQCLTQHGNWLGASGAMCEIRLCADQDGQFTLSERIADAQFLISSFKAPSLV